MPSGVYTRTKLSHRKGMTMEEEYGVERAKKLKERTRDTRMEGINAGRIVSWNKGKTGLQVAWNKGLTKEIDERVGKMSKNVSKSVKELWKDAKYREKCVKAITKNWQNPEYRKSQTKAITKGANRSETKAKQREVNNRPEVKKKRSEARKKLWKNSDWRKRQIKLIKRTINQPEVREKKSRARKKLWQDPEYVRKQMKAYHVTPNKVEMELDKLLQQILSNEYKYVGSGEFILAGKCPDFVNVNGQKKLIELYGDYWHQGETGEDRKALFRKYGYQTLIVWEHELEDIVSLKSKLLEFNGR